MLPTDFPSIPAMDYDLDPNAVLPTDLEQFLLELINRARADRDAEHQRILDNIDSLAMFPDPDPNDYNIAQGVSATPKEALAWNSSLGQASREHSQDMIDRDFFAHTNPDGVTARERAEAAGYPAEYMLLIGGQVVQGAWIRENLSAIYSVGPGFPVDQARVEIHHANLWKSDGHQQGMMAEDITEAGIGIDIGSVILPAGDPPELYDFDNSSMVTEKFGDANKMFLTGVVINDANGNSFYDVGEGQADVHVTAYNASGSFVTSSFGSGGYSLELEAGTYTVVFNDGDLGTLTSVHTVTMGTENVKLDVFENLLVAVDPVAVYSDDTFSTQLSSHGSFALALAAAAANNGIMINDAAGIGSVGAQAVAVENLTVQGDDPFDGVFTLDAGISDFALAGSNTANVIGNVSANSLEGSDGSNSLEGRAGDDVIIGNGGDDTLRGNNGHDDLDGGAGDDFLNGGSGMDTLDGGADNDTLQGGRDADELNGGIGNDQLIGGGGHDVMNGDSGMDTLKGGGGNDTMNGGDEADSLFGQKGNDVMNGGGGADVVNGAGGHDVLIVGTGQGGDTLIGGYGDDTFEFEGGFGTATINDFTSGADIIDLSATTITGLLDLGITYGANATINADGDILTLVGVTGGLTDADFLFGGLLEG